MSINTLGLGGQTIITLGLGVDGFGVVVSGCEITKTINILIFTNKSINVLTIASKTLNATTQQDIQLNAVTMANKALNAVTMKQITLEECS